MMTGKEQRSAGQKAEIGSIQTPELSPVKASPISAGPARADGKEAIIILRNKGLFSG